MSPDFITAGLPKQPLLFTACSALPPLLLFLPFGRHPQPMVRRWRVVRAVLLRPYHQQGVPALKGTPEGLQVCPVGSGPVGGAVACDSQPVRSKWSNRAFLPSSPWP